MIHQFVPVIASGIHDHLGVPTGLPATPGLSRFLYISAVSLGIASLSWPLFERPINDLKRYFPYVRHS